MPEKSLYEVLGVDRRAHQEELEAAFHEAVEARRASRKSASDLHAAFAVIGDPSLRKAYDVVQLGRATNEKLSAVGSTVIDAVPEVDWAEVRKEAKQTALKAAFLISGATVKVANATARVFSRLQIEAAKRIGLEES